MSIKQRTLEDYYQVNPMYIEELYFLQVELLKLQKYIFESKKRLVIIFEGRDTAGKGSAIFRFSQFLNPRHYRVVALGKPSEVQMGQWYFQRYLKELPNAGEIVFFDRSWYNRAVVEPVMGFCTAEEYDRFMKQVVQVEDMLVDDGIILVKLWFSINLGVQKERIQSRMSSPLKHWKVSPVDLLATEKWDDFTRYKNQMFNGTSTLKNPWVIVKGNEREKGRIGAINYVLSKFDYDGRDPKIELPDPEIVVPYSI